MAGSVIGAGLGLLGADKAASEAKKNRKMQKKQMEALAKVKFNPFSTNFNGAGVDFSNGQANFNMGGFQGAFDQFGSNADMFAGNMGGLQQMLGQAGQNVQNRQGPFQQGLQDSFFGGAQQFANRANQGFDGLRDEMLGTLRAQAQPFEDRAFTGMLDNQFAQGRLGSTGGSLQTEAFARGLGQADLDRQLASISQAQNLQSQQAGLAQNFAGAGQGLVGQGDQLLQSALQQFSGVQGLLGQNQQFQQGALGGQQNIMQMLMGLGQFGANLGATQADIGLGAAGGAANVGNNIAGQAGSGDIMGQFLGTLGQNVSGGGFSGMNNPFAGLFGGGQAAPPALFNNPAQFLSGGNNGP